MPSIRKKLPELLAPAGSPACALAAFDAGADAVYAGLSKFNARERGENFTPEVMAQIVDYAHKLGRKVYITLNTLVKESELIEVLDMLAVLDGIGPDALLVQDLGVLRIAREYFPDLALHASTQMGFHNSAGLKVAEQLGVTRAVLERQITMDELRAIKKETNLELEVFVHGALCCSLSGACLLSSSMGGYSGNRGKCKQPCRRRYYSREGNGFFLSPQDLCSVDLLPELCEIGVASLKVEGRLRQPDYVANTVQAYRMLLDAPAEEFAKLLPEARNLLSKTCGRRWSHGFYSAESARELIKFDSVGAAGVRCGTVEAVRDNGFGFTATKRLFMGDRLRIQPVSGDDGAALTLTRLFVENEPSRRVMPGERVFVCCDKPVPPGGMIFKIGESFPDYSKRLAALPPRREQLEVELSLTARQLTVKVLNAPLSDWSFPVELTAAEKHPVTAERLREEFSASDSADFALGKFRASVEPLFFPAAELKAARREFWKFVTANLQPGMVIRDGAAALDRYRADYLALKPEYHLPERLIETVAMKPKGAEPADRRAIRADGVFDVNKLTNEAILPEFCPEGRLKSLVKAIAFAYSSGVRRFRVTALYGLELLRDFDDITVCVSTPLPVCNSMAVKELMKFKVDRVMVHIELSRADIDELLKHSPLPLECFRLGRPALLTSRAKIPFDGAFRDARNNEFELRSDHRDGLTRVFSQAVLSIPRLEGVYDFYDLRNAHWKNSETNTFNLDGSWM